MLKRSGLITFFQEIYQKKNLSDFVLLRPSLTISAKMSSNFFFDLISVIAYLKIKFILNVLIVSSHES